jgi:hypothetical protein
MNGWFPASLLAQWIYWLRRAFQRPDVHVVGDRASPSTTIEVGGGVAEYDWEADDWLAGERLSYYGLSADDTCCAIKGVKLTAPDHSEAWPPLAMPSLVGWDEVDCTDPNAVYTKSGRWNVA